MRQERRYEMINDMINNKVKTLKSMPKGGQPMFIDGEHI